MSNLETILQKIKKSKKIMIVTDSKKMALSSALYTYVLMQHRSVSLVCEEIDLNVARLSFLPWFDKIKSKKNLSADLEIEVDFSSLEFYALLKKESIKINKKIATALYASLLKESDGFLNPDANGIVFAMAKELIESGADYKLCTRKLLQTKSLALFRLKSLMFKSMLLQNSAKDAIFKIDDDDLKSSGATKEDCDEVLREALHLPMVERVVLKNSRDKIIKIKER